jgi:hypothetical protein
LAGNGDKWRWADSEGVQRVVTTDELREAFANGVLPPTTLVWRGGMPKWQRASEVPDLMSAPSPSLPTAHAAEEGSAPPSGGPGSNAAGRVNLKATMVGLGGQTALTEEARKALLPGTIVSSEKKRSVPPGEKRKSSAPPGGATSSPPLPGPASTDPTKSLPPSGSGASKKKSAPPPPPPAPVTHAAAVVGVASPEVPVSSAEPSSAAPSSAAASSASAAAFRAEAARAQVPKNAWGARSSRAAPTPATPPPAVAKPAWTPASPPAAILKPLAEPPSSPVSFSGLAETPASPVQALSRDSDTDETWVAKPAFSQHELAAAAAEFAASKAPVPVVIDSKLLPTATPPPVAVMASALASSGPISQPPTTRPSAFPLTGLPPTRSTSPLPPPPRRSHPAGAGAPPSTAPQAFSQSSAAQVAAFAAPSVPPLQPAAPVVASPNGGADGDLPAFPLDEIDPDDERPFRGSQAEIVTSPSHPVPVGSGGALAYIKANPKDPKVLGALSAGALVVVGLLAFAAFSGGSSKSKSDEETAAKAGAAASASAAALAPLPEPAKAPPVAACRLTGAPSRLAEKASKDIPLEILVASSSERARLGFATSEKGAQGVAIDLASLQVTPEFSKPPRERLRAVLPFGEDTAHYVTQLEGHNDKVKAWRTISTDPPAVIGWSGTALAVTSKANHAPTTLFALDGSDPIDAIRVAHAADGSHAVVFRRHGGIHGAMIGSDRSPLGDVARIAGAGAPPGSPVGTPTIAVNDQSVAVAFADRASSDEPWSIRVGTAPLGSFPTSTTPFVAPPGGPGGATLAPALAGLPDGRWLLVWTEGSGGAHDVRGVTLGADLTPIGSALTVSREGSNAGQGAVALRKGRGLVAYLALTEEGYEVWGTGVDCR